jgi:hypothetical protein
MDTSEEQEKMLLSKVPETGDPVGNISLIREMGWTAEDYWLVRNRLVDQGVLELGRGKGGSVRRAAKMAIAAALAQPSAPDGTQLQQDYDKENQLYEPMAKVIADSWAADRGFDDKIVQITAQQGGKVTGKWSRPDVAVAALSTYPYVPNRHFDVVTFEIKTPDGIDITSVYESLAHLRSATRSYVLLYVPPERAAKLESSLLEVYAEAKKHGIGVITAGNAADYETWDEIVDPVRADPDPRRLNDFLAKQFTKEQLERIVRWFR